MAFSTSIRGHHHLQGNVRDHRKGDTRRSLGLGDPAPGRGFHMARCGRLGRRGGVGCGPFVRDVVPARTLQNGADARRIGKAILQSGVGFLSFLFSRARHAGMPAHKALRCGCGLDQQFPLGALGVATTSACWILAPVSLSQLRC